MAEASGVALLGLPTNDGAARRQMIALGSIFLIACASAIGRLGYYGLTVLASTVYSVSSSAIFLALLFALSRATASNPGKMLRYGLIVSLAAGALRSSGELLIERYWPGLMFPSVLYRETPSLGLSVLNQWTSNILVLAAWVSIIEAQWRQQLLRVHRNWLVNAGSVMEIVRDGAEVVLRLGAGTTPSLEVPVSRERSAEVRAALLGRLDEGGG